MNLFRQVSTFLFCLVAAVFVQAYSHIQANILQFAHRLDMAHLPLLPCFTAWRTGSRLISGPCCAWNGSIRSNSVSDEKGRPGSIPARLYRFHQNGLRAVPALNGLHRFQEYLSAGSWLSCVPLSTASIRNCSLTYISVIFASRGKYRQGTCCQQQNHCERNALFH